MNVRSEIVETAIAYINSPLGVVRLQCANDKMYSISFDDSGPAQSTLPCSHPLLQCAIEQLKAYFEGRLIQFDLPLFLGGTAFQQLVWHHLITLKYGTTVTYLQLAEAVCNDRYTRAVAAANGRNPLAIVIPCHRVVGAKNALVGYSGSLWRKRELLKLEARFSPVGLWK